MYLLSESMHITLHGRVSTSASSDIESLYVAADSRTDLRSSLLALPLLSTLTFEGNLLYCCVANRYSVLHLPFLETGASPRREQAVTHIVSDVL